MSLVAYCLISRAPRCRSNTIVASLNVKCWYRANWDKFSSVTYKVYPVVDGKRMKSVSTRRDFPELDKKTEKRRQKLEKIDLFAGVSRRVVDTSGLSYQPAKLTSARWRWFVCVARNRRRALEWHTRQHICRNENRIAAKKD